jgi:hypothetical protein
VPESKNLPPGLKRLLGGQGFKARRKLSIPLLTCDPEGIPRAALLAFSEIRALSASRLAVAVASGSRTEANLIRRRGVTVLLLDAGLSVSIRARAGKGRPSVSVPDKKIFPLSVISVKEDAPLPGESTLALASGPRFAGPNAEAIFSPALFAELASP